MLNYPDKNVVVETLAEVAKRAGMDCSSQHPEDIAIAMSMAIDAAGTTLTVLMQNGNLTLPSLV